MTLQIQHQASPAAQAECRPADQQRLLISTEQQNLSRNLTSYLLFTCNMKHEQAVAADHAYHDCSMTVVAVCKKCVSSHRLRKQLAMSLCVCVYDHHEYTTLTTYDSFPLVTTRYLVYGGMFLQYYCRGLNLVKVMVSCVQRTQGHMLISNLKSGKDE